jgi:hypothetical protein
MDNYIAKLVQAEKDNATLEKRNDELTDRINAAESYLEQNNLPLPAISRRRRDRQDTQPLKTVE